MQLPIKGKREKESISEIRSKPIPADVTAKIVLISHPFARRYRTGAVPRPVSLKAAISARTNAPERAESISGHPAPGTLRLGRTEPYRRLRIRTISAARAKPYAPAPFGRVRRKRRNRSPNNRGRNACALPFAVCTNVPVLIKESYLCHTEGGARPRSAIRRTSGRVRASVGTTSPTATGKRPCSAIRRMYKRAGADEKIAPLACRRREHSARCHSQNVRACPHKRRNNIPHSSGKNARALPFAVCTNVPVLIKESYLCHTEGGARPRAAIRRTSGRVRASVGTTSPTATGKTPVLGNFQSVRLFRRTWTHSTARFASALPAAKGRRTPPSPSVWKARFTNLFAEKIPPLPSYGGISYPS